MLTRTMLALGVLIVVVVVKDPMFWHVYEPTNERERRSSVRRSCEGFEIETTCSPRQLDNSYGDIYHAYESY